MLQGAGLYAVGDAAAAAEIYDQKGQGLLAETAQLHSSRLFGYTLVAINLASTFAYNIVCKRALRKMELPVPSPLRCPPRLSVGTSCCDDFSAQCGCTPQQRLRSARVFCCRILQRQWRPQHLRLCREGVLPSCASLAEATLNHSL